MRFTNPSAQTGGVTIQFSSPINHAELLSDYMGLDAQFCKTGPCFKCQLQKGCPHCTHFSCADYKFRSSDNPVLQAKYFTGRAHRTQEKLLIDIYWFIIKYSTKKESNGEDI